MENKMLTSRETSEYIRELEYRHKSCLEQIERYKSVAAESTRSLQGYELLSRFSGDIILFIRRSDNRIIQFNDTALKSYGYAPDELRLLPISSLRAPDGAPPSASLLEKLDLTGIRFESIHQRKDGTSFPVEVSSVAAEIGDERIIISTIRDITERRRAEIALRDSELKYRSLFEAAEDGIFLQNETGFVDCNDAGARMYGLEKKDLIGKLPSTLCPEYQPDMRLSTEVALEKASEALKGTTQKFEWAFRRADGVVSNADITLSRIGDAGSRLLLATVRDITERKRSQEALRRSQESLAEAQKQAHIGSFEYDFRSKSLEWSDEMFRILGTDRKDFRGNKEEDFFTRIHPEDLHQVTETIEAWLYKAGALRLRFRIVRPNGDTRFIRMIEENAYDNHGTLLRRIGTFQDITEQVLAESEKAKLESQLNQAQKIESVGLLAGGVAHDFNNMLGVILGHTELALEQIDPNNPICENLKIIQVAGRHSADLTRQLLTFARKQAIAPRLLDLNETIGNLLKMLRTLIGENIQIKWQPVPGLWPVKVDPSQMDQMITNLCVNARDAISEIGQISIRMENCGIDPTYHSSQEGISPGEYVRIAVIDNGCGMERKVVERVFEPFFTTKKFGHGTGLGLATVYGAVRQNNGFMDVESELGVGTTFYIYLPRQEESLQNPIKKERPAIKDKKTILLVEDEPQILNLVALLLQRQGYRVIACASPIEAIRLAGEKSGEIDLLLTDVIMPEMNGRVLAEQLQSLCNGIKCVFMSGYTADTIAKKGILDKDVNFIQKPFSADELAAKLSIVFGWQ